MSEVTRKQKTDLYSSAEAIAAKHTVDNPKQPNFLRQTLQQQEILLDIWYTIF